MSKSKSLYQRVKRHLKLAQPARSEAIAEELKADPDATRLALNELKRRGQAVDCGHPSDTHKSWSLR